MSHKGVRSGAPIDWNDPEQAATQTRIDALYNMLSRNPMSYSEKEGFVRQSLADESKRSAQTVRDKKDNLKKDWDI